MYFLFIRNDMFHSNKHFNRIIVITGACLIISAAPIFANAQPVVDSPANVKLQNIYDRLGSMYQNCMVPQYNILNTYCNYKLSDLNQSILAVGGQTADVSSKLITTNNYLSSIDSKQKDYTSYVDNIESYLDRLNWVSWTNTNSQLSNIYGDDGTLNPSHYPYSGTYLDFEFPQVNVNNNNLFRVKLPIQYWWQRSSSSYVKSISIINGSNEVLIDTLTYTYDATDLTLNLIFSSLPANPAYNFIIRVYLNDGVTYTSNKPYIQYLSDDNIDYYLVGFLNVLRDQNNSINKLANVYASDDVIAAKENQQAYEDQAITDFTGSGSAAASGSDTTNMKNVSGAIKSGLDTGGSVNGALGVFNTSGGLWDWFSQSNYDEINGTQTRSRGSEVYIDFYNTNREELERLLQEDNR